jgi:hypothetical protein
MSNQDVNIIDNIDSGMVDFKHERRRARKAGEEFRTLQFHLSSAALSRRIVRNPSGYQ